MSWHKLNNMELQACRKLLMLEVSEAALLVAGHSNSRTWQRYEKGDANIPDDIDMEIYGLIQQRNNKITELTNWQIKNEGKALKMKFYHSFDDYQKDFPDQNKVSWRIHQAAVSFVFSEGGEVELI